MTNPGITALAAFALCALWQIPLLAAAACLSARLLRSLGPAAEHKLWVTAYLLAIVLPAAAAITHLVQAMPGHLRVTTRLLPAPAMPPFVSDPAISSVHLPASLLASLAVGYLGFVLFRLARFTLSLSATRRLLREAQPLPLTSQAAAIWADCRHLSPSLANVRLLQSDHIPGPVTIGSRHPAILFPPAFTDRLTPIELQAALAHEAAHLHRHDFTKNLVYEALGCLIAFHPAAWLLQSHLAETREMVCDAVAARLLPARSVYLQSLLRLATLVATHPPTPSHAIGIFDANILEKRLMTLNAPAPSTSKPRSAAAILLAAAGLCCTVTVALLAAPSLTPSVSASTAAAPSQDHVYTVGGAVKSPQLIYEKEPEFPASGRNLPATFKGACLLGFTVDRSGIPQNVHVLHSLNQDFDAKAIESVQQYRFKPAELSGKPVSAAMKIEVNFQRF